ncbi:transposase [Pseudomonas sp. IT-P253]
MTERNDSSADSRKVGFLLKEQQARQLHSICVGGSLWAVRGVNTKALTMLRGPIRRRPYNRGEIVSKKRGEMDVFDDFY